MYTKIKKTLLTWPDMRKGDCYKEYVNVSSRANDIICSEAWPQQQTRFMCCCVFGAAWGEPCKACPVKGSRELPAPTG